MTHDSQTFIYQFIDPILEKYLSQIESYNKFDDIDTDIQLYNNDALYSLFGLSDPRFIKLRYGAGFANACATNIGRFFEKSFKLILCKSFNLTESAVSLSVNLTVGRASEKRETDGVLRLNDIRDEYAKARILNIIKQEKNEHTLYKNKEIVGFGFEARVRYGKHDAKLLQADEHMANKLIDQGLLPIMIIFSNSSDSFLLDRMKTNWILKDGVKAYHFIKEVTEFDFEDYFSQKSERIKQFKKNVNEKYEKLH